jgi:hypothetical protein
MIVKYYAIMDLKAQHFLKVLAFQNHGEAIRWFSTQVNGNKQESLIARFPSDYMLFHMFDMDDKTGMTGTELNGELKTQETPKELIMGASCIEEENKQFTVKELITLLKTELNLDNVVNLTDEVAQK